jgi:hypothetical protein
VNPTLIGELIQLRYQLMWARTRTRNGKIALFVIGYLLLVLVIAVMAAGGFGAAALAVKSGKAEFVTRIVLTSLFAQALLGTVMMGFGLNSIFSDVELRRYPVSASDRRLARHLIGVIDPFWILTFALEIGLVVGLYVWGGPGNIALGFLAVLLLLPANYLVARLIETVISRMMQGPSGSTFVMIGVLALSLSGLVIPPVVKRFPWLVDGVLAGLAWSPPFGAAAAATRSGAAVASGLGLELVWIVALAAALVWLEQRPAERQTVATTTMKFESGYDRVAAALGFTYAPLVGWWLRFYCRNARFKAMLVIAPVLVGFLTFNVGMGGGRKGGGVGLFAAALGTIPIVTFLATSRFMVNQFGYLGGGYRRCFLLPVAPAVVLQTGSYASLLLGAAFIPVAAGAWVAFAPVPFDARQLFMLLASATTGLFVFHALGLWASIYGPRRGNYNQSLGNDLSLMGNLVLIGGVFSCMLAPPLARNFLPGAYNPANWWMWMAPPIAAMAFYSATLRATSGLVTQKREQLMAVVEGKA